MFTLVLMSIFALSPEVTLNHFEDRIKNIDNLQYYEKIEFRQNNYHLNISGFNDTQLRMFYLYQGESVALQIDSCLAKWRANEVELSYIQDLLKLRERHGVKLQAMAKEYFDRIPNTVVSDDEKQQYQARIKKWHQKHPIRAKPLQATSSNRF